MVADEIKTESVEAIKNLHALGIKVVMLTGDDQKAAKYIGSLVGIDDVVAHVLPQDKLEKIKELQREGSITYNYWLANKTAIEKMIDFFLLIFFKTKEAVLLRQPLYSILCG